MNRALYPGSFDPFTIGHLSILKKALNVFDEIIIVFSQNPKKRRRFDTTYSIYCLLKYLKSYNFYDGKVKVTWSPDFIPAKIAQDKNCNYIIRGLRNDIDYNYEEGLAKLNKEVCPDIETIYFRADNDTISSTMVYSLYKSGIPIDKYLPYDSSLLMEYNDNIIERTLTQDKEVLEYVSNYNTNTWGLV